MTGNEICSYFTQCGIDYASTVLHDRPVVTLRFHNDSKLQSLIKRHGGSWSHALDCWYVDEERSHLTRLVRNLALAKGIVTEREEVLALRKKVQMKGYSLETERNYVRVFEAFLDYYPDQKPEELSNHEIEDYLIFLQTHYKLSDSSINTVVNAIKFYLEQVAKPSGTVYRLQRPKNPLKMPGVFSRDEIAAIIKSTTNLKHKTMLVLCYSGGLRNSEIIRLRISDVDQAKMMLNIRAVKAKKDRLVPLSPTALNYLGEYYECYQPKEFVFEGHSAGGAYSSRSLQNMFMAAKERAGIARPGSIHTLRHSYAAHLLENGVDVNYVQKILGHNALKTTLKYRQVTSFDPSRIISPMEDLAL